MLAEEKGTGHLQTELREEVLEKYQRAATARGEYLLRRQRKEILEKRRRIAVVGASSYPNSESYVSTEKLLGLGVEIAVVLPGCEKYLGFPCYARLQDVPGDVDIVQVYPREGLDRIALAREAVEKGVKAFWVEEGPAGKEAAEILAEGKVQVVEYESLEREYIKHLPFPVAERGPAQVERRSITVAERMTKNPVTVMVTDGINEAIEKMEKGKFRHLPVIDDEGRLLGMLSDRDIRLIRPSLAFVSAEEAAVQVWSTAVRQAAVFDPVSIRADASLKHAAELMLRWEIGGLPVTNKGLLLGIITYTDLLREFAAA